MSLMSFTITLQNSSETVFANCVPTTTFKYFPLLKKKKNKQMNKQKTKTKNQPNNFLREERGNIINIEIKHLATGIFLYFWSRIKYWHASGIKEIFINQTLFKAVE